MRKAISPLFATRTLDSMLITHDQDVLVVFENCPQGCLPKAPSIRSDLKQGLPVFNGLAITDQDFGDGSAHLGLDFV